jgi:lipoyl(octanoyl) transferase
MSNVVEAGSQFVVEPQGAGLKVAAAAGLEWRRSHDLVAYERAVAAMEARVAALAAGDAAELVWLLEHPPLLTAGTSAAAADLLDAGRFPVHRTGRGGKFTYHGPGQRVVYAVLDLRRRHQDLRWYVHTLEEWVIRTLASFGLEAFRRDGRVGIWVETAPGQEAKIGAIGVRVRRWIAYHGIAINVAPALDHFTSIVPCGIAEFGVTSLEALGRGTDMALVDAELARHFPALLGRSEG